MAPGITNDGPATNGHTNGTNGVRASSKPGLGTSLPVTIILADWIASSTTSSLTPSMRTKLSDLILDYIGITASAAHTSESTPSIISALTALNPPSPSQPCTVIASFLRHPPHIASLLNATFAHSLDFDDTHAPSTLHPGVTSISAALACAETLSPAPSNDTLLLAISIAYEVTCRLGTELGFPAYSRGFHNTSTAGIFGAIAAIAVLKSLSSSIIANAFGLAGSCAAGSMQYLDNGSHNKRLHPGFASHDAFVCVALAEAGVVGATRIIEGKMGFLHAYSPNSDMDLNRLVKGLGSDWRFLDTALKPYPACRMTHGVIEVAGRLGKEHKGREVKRIEVRLRTANMSLVGDRTKNKVHPEREVDAQFSAYFQAAHAWVYGSREGYKAYTRMEDEEVGKLCDKVECVTDDESEATKEMGCIVSVEWEDGGSERVEMRYPLGEREHPFAREEVEAKFRTCVDGVWDEERAKRVVEAVEAVCGEGGKGVVRELMALVA
jgi:2-methylcitrate dehydratase PrpD